MPTTRADAKNISRSEKLRVHRGRATAELLGFFRRASRILPSSLAAVASLKPECIGDAWFEAAVASFSTSLEDLLGPTKGSSQDVKTSSKELPSIANDTLHLLESLPDMATVYDVRFRGTKLRGRRQVLKFKREPLMWKEYKNRVKSENVIAKKGKS
ncbi:hypothetical protein BCR34DRAFT_597278 [Clohesyomyces aquaticus]|uniref:Uncharacterized protein n=1 Tax=Clohesyomyces aquaticus TaxID=1231657 RepID=A0A1Y2A2X7_9PLEO|nr:hypothetical protein BCR34DRAFT_597278 [Clohesyomyces aquaticus]